MANLAAIFRLMAAPTLSEGLRQPVVVEDSTREEFAATITTDFAKGAKVVAAAGIKADR